MIASGRMEGGLGANKAYNKRQDIRPNTGNSQMIDSLSMNHFSNQNTGGGSDQASLDENVSNLSATAYSNFLTDIT